MTSRVIARSPLGGKSMFYAGKVVHAKLHLTGRDTSWMPFVLPHSGLTLQIATMLGVRANGDAADPGAVTPDIVVRRTAEDIRKLFDPVLERAMSCPSRSVQ